MFMKIATIFLTKSQLKNDLKYKAEKNLFFFKFTGQIQNLHIDAIGI